MEEYQIYQKLARLEATKNQLQIKLAAVIDRISELHTELEKEMPEIYNETGVYVIRSANRYKIGYARNVYGRINQIQTGSPFRCRIIIFIPCPIEQAIKLEERLHLHFHPQRKTGEWFELNQSDLKELVDICKYQYHQDVLQTLFDECELAEEDIFIMPPRDKTRAILDIIKEIAEGEKRGVPISSIFQRSASLGISEDETRQILDRMRRDGDLFEPRPGLLKLP